MTNFQGLKSQQEKLQSWKKSEKTYQVPYLFEWVPTFERAPFSNEHSPFDENFVMGAVKGGAPSNT